MSQIDATVNPCQKPEGLLLLPHFLPILLCLLLFFSSGGCSRPKLDFQFKLFSLCREQSPKWNITPKSFCPVVHSSNESPEGFGLSITHSHSPNHVVVEHRRMVS